MLAHERGVPVLVCCETYKFAERVLLDSICYNELADPDDLVPPEPDASKVRWPRSEGSAASEARREEREVAVPPLPHGRRYPWPRRPCFRGRQVADWRDMPRLKLLNLMYDVTPMKYVTMVVTEAGVVPPTSVPVIIREDAARMQLQAQEAM